MTRASKFLALILRHDPSRIGLVLDANGYAEIDVLLTQLAKHGESLTRAELDDLVRTSDKKRYAISEDGTKVRASQGHSFGVNLGLFAIAPPARLFHGTVTRVIESIRATGLTPRGRTHVHLSADEETARAVARRRQGPHAILVVHAKEMHDAGHPFFRSENRVWLAHEVPPAFIEFPT